MLGPQPKSQEAKSMFDDLSEEIIIIEEEGASFSKASLSDKSSSIVQQKEEKKNMDSQQRVSRPLQVEEIFFQDSEEIFVEELSKKKLSGDIQNHAKPHQEDVRLDKGKPVVGKILESDETNSIQEELEFIETEISSEEASSRKQSDAPVETIQANPDKGVSGKSIIDILSSRGWLDKKMREALEAETMVDAKRRSWEIAVNRGYISTKMLAEAMAEAYGLSFIKTADLIKDVNRQHLSEHLSVYTSISSLPLVNSGVAIKDPINAEHSIQTIKGTGIATSKIFVADAGDIAMILGEAHASMRISIQETTDWINRNKGDTVKILDHILKMSIEHKASDIHMEPYGTSAIVRVRINGDMEPLAYLPFDGYKKVVTALTNRAGVVVQNRSKDMDGQFEFDINKHKIQMRTAFFPTIYDVHAVVIRILDTRQTQYRLETLGYEESDVSGLLKIIKNLSSGIILITGPTGSGKSASVHAIASEMDLETKKLYEVSDPVEYRTPRGVQAQVYEVNEDSKWDFADAGRSLKRMDPNIFYLGEIRDRESATEAIVSARTGILVMSTLHTTRAFDTFKRLQDLGVSGTDLIDVLKVVINQRLIKRLCTSCRVIRPVTKEDRIGLFEELMKDVHSVYESAPDGTDCNVCGSRGYTGRYAMAEIVYMNPNLKKTLMEHPNIGGDMLEMEYNKKSGGGLKWLSIYEKAVRDVQAGKTSMSAVIKTLGVL